MKKSHKPLFLEAIIFSTLWIQYMLVFSPMRYPRGCEAINACGLLIDQNHLLKAVMTYGIWIPLLSSLAKEFTSPDENIKKTFLLLTLSISIYFLIIIMTEITYGSINSSIIQLYLTILTPSAAIGLIAGRFLKKLFTQ